MYVKTAEGDRILIAFSFDLISFLHPLPLAYHSFGWLSSDPNEFSYMMHVEIQMGQMLQNLVISR